MTDDPGAILESQRAQSRDPSPVSAALRKDRLRRAIEALSSHESRFCHALAEDFGVRAREQSQLYDIVASLQTLRHTLKHVDRWMRPERRPVDMALRLFGASAWIEYQPKGVVGILSPWNFPLYLTFGPLAGVLAAGNRAMIKPSEHSPATSSVLSDAISSAFDQDEIAVVTGGADVAAAFSALPFDHIIFTGSTAVGRHVMRAAADNLVPLTLELGGKSPVIVGSNADTALMCDRIVTGKLLNAGQICLAPDYMLVPASEEAAVAKGIAAAAEAIYPNLTANPEYASVLGDRNRERLSRYVEEARARGARVTEIGARANDGRLPFTILQDCPLDAAVMKDEIFGPILPILSYGSLDEAIAFVNARPRPLGLYFFGRDKTEEREVLSRTVSGGVTLNDVVFHVTVEDLPFGGIGESGFGVYHGIEGFREFSNARGIFRQSRFDVARIAGFRPPYGAKLRKFIAKNLGGSRAH